MEYFLQNISKEIHVWETLWHKREIKSWVKDEIHEHGGLYQHIFGYVTLCALHKGWENENTTVF